MQNQNSTKKGIFSFLFEERVSSGDKESFFENLARMVSSSIDITDALEIIRNETRSRGVKLLVDQIEKDINNGTSIWRSLEKAKIIPNHLLSVVRIGEESGRLDENLKIVIKQIRKQKEFNSKLRSASLYPLFVFGLMIGVGGLITVFVLPRITTVYKTLKVELPAVTQLLINFGEFIEKYGHIAIPLFLLISFYLTYILFVYKKTKHIGQELIFRLPVLKNLFFEVELSRFGFLLGTLLETGYPIIDALGLLEYSTDIFRYKKFYKYLQQSINEGFNFGQSFNRYKDIDKVMPAYARQLVISSEKSGDFAKSLKNIGKVYEEKNENTIKDFSVLIEPVLLVLVWVGVAFVALAVILPIYSLVGNINEISSPGTTAPVEDINE